MAVRSASVSFERPHATADDEKLEEETSRISAATDSWTHIMETAATVADRSGTAFPELTPAMQEEVSEALKLGRAHEVVASAFSLIVRRGDMATLRDGQWINDNVVNFYLAMLAERSQKRGAPLVYAFSTFFFPKLQHCGHRGVQRWTRGVDIFAYDILLVPLHMVEHWCLAVVDFRTLKFLIYDSLSPCRVQPECVDTLGLYLEEEGRVRGRALKWGGWKVFPRRDVPLQKNHSDCGVFMCQYAECVSRDAPISFSQVHMPYFRRRVAYEILHRRLLEG